MAEDEYWTDAQIIEYLADLGINGPKTLASVEQWRIRHDIKLKRLASAEEVREAAASLPGRSWRKGKAQTSEEP